MQAKSTSLVVAVTLWALPIGMAAALAAEEKDKASAAAAAPGKLQPFTSGGHVLGFEDTGYYVSNGTYALRVEFEGARPVAPATQGQPATGHRSASTSTAAPLERVTYAGLWEGIDGAYDTGGGILRSTWTIAPGADPTAIRLRYNQPVEITGQGELGVRFEAGALTESRPIAWQEIDGQRHPVEVAFTQIKDDVIGFALEEYRHDLPLTIDPTLTWNTFLGGNDHDFGYGIAVDGSGNVYVTGYSKSTWGSPVRPYSGDYDAFVTCLSAAGELTWNTFLGSSSTDYGDSIAVDGSGDIYVAGISFFTWGSPIRAHSGSSNAFVARLSSSGVLVWNTFLGPSNPDDHKSIAVDDSGSAYVTGQSSSTWGSPIRAYSGGGDAFVARLDSLGALVWNTFLGGSSIDSGYSVAVDDSDNVYVTGRSLATWGSPLLGGPGAFVARLSSAGALTWNTFLGGNQQDFGYGITVDSSDNIYVTGKSDHTWGSPVRAYSVGDDAFVARLNSAGALIWNTFLGSSSHDAGQSIVVDSSGNIYVAGYSISTWGTPVRAHSGNLDAFVARLSSAGVLASNTFLGGSSADEGYALAMDSSSNVHVVGVSNSTTWGSPIRAHSGANDAFVAQLSSGLETTPTFTRTSTPTHPPTASPSHTSTQTPTTSPTHTPTWTPTYTLTSTPSITPTLTPTTSATPTSTQTPAATATPFCGDGNVDDGEECDDGNNLDGDCCDATCDFEPADTACDDGDPLTCPDRCDGAGTCVPGHEESPACPNTCCDGVDNDGNGTLDLEDPECGLGKEARFALITTSSRPKAIKMGGRVEVDSLDIPVDRLDCDETYLYRSKAGVCGASMSYLRGGEAGFITTLAANGQTTFFGGGFDLRSHWVSNGTPESLKGEVPLVGPGTCSLGGEECSQSLVANLCPSDSAGACCADPSAVCQGRQSLKDPTNLHVHRDGSHADFSTCQQLQTQLGADAAAVAALAPNHPDYSNVLGPKKIRIRPQKVTPPSHCEMGQPDACSAACAASCTVMLGAGQQVLYVDSVDVGKNTELRLCRDFGLSESDPPTVAIVRIEKNLKLGGGGKVTACGVPADRILWNAEGSRGSVKLAANASLVGTILAPGRRAITVGGGARIDGSLYTQKVNFKKDAKLFHYPFSAGVE